MQLALRGACCGPTRRNVYGCPSHIEFSAKVRFGVRHEVMPGASACEAMVGTLTLTLKISELRLIPERSRT